METDARHIATNPGVFFLDRCKRKAERCAVPATASLCSVRLMVLRVLCARAFRPLASFFVYAGLQLPHEVSCLGKEEMWTVEREKKKKQKKKTNRKPNLFPVNICWLYGDCMMQKKR